MKIEIKLDNPEDCTYCPCLFMDETIGFTHCQFGYELDPGLSGNKIRPKQCIKENGK